MLKKELLLYLPEIKEKQDVEILTFNEGVPKNQISTCEKNEVIQS